MIFHSARLVYVVRNTLDCSVNYVAVPHYAHVDERQRSLASVSCYRANPRVLLHWLIRSLIP